MTNLSGLPESGTLLIDKPSNMTSFGVVARLRRVLKDQFKKKVKVGHTGTLDPFATGLLIIVYGKETKQAMKLTKLDKVYEAEFTLGETSTTGDPEGKIASIDVKKIPTELDIKATLNKFIGDIKQTPPVFSAIKIDGQRAYNLARKGKMPDIPERLVKIYDIDLISYDWPRVVVKAHVSSGTYIRSLAEDIGNELRTGAYCSKLRRLKIADFDVEDAQQLSDFGITD